MTRFSAKSFQQLRNLVLENTHPLCLLIDTENCLNVCTGDLSYYGYHSIRPGEDCSELMPFLVGHNPTDSIQLRFLETPNGRSAHVYFRPQQDAYMVTFLDATEQRSNHGKMQQKANELALLHDEQCRLIKVMEQLEQQLEFKRVEAEKANSLKSRFIANMSHEFRTPLTSILGFTTLIRQSLNHEPQQIQYLASVERGAKHLLSMIENLLEQSQIEAGGVEIHPIATDVNQLLDEVQQTLKPLADDRKLSFTLTKTNIPDALSIDELRIRQILLNLIGNAIKFTDEGGIEVVASWRANDLKFSVSDSGIGIAESDRDKIFKPFEQLDRRLGSGLGLSIVKQIVETMNGAVSLDSTPGIGSRFEISVPAPIIESDLVKDSLPDYTENPNQLPASALQILIVEDDEDIVNLLLALFDKQYYQVTTAKNGAEAIEKTLALWPDIVFMDLNVPEIDGIEATRSLRERGFSNAIFALSAWNSTEYKAKAIEVGCNDYLLKPLNLSRLLTLVSDYSRMNIHSDIPNDRISELADRFHASLPEKLNNLESIVGKRPTFPAENAAIKDLQLFSHRLAGSAALYGFESISKIAKELDRLLMDYAARPAQAEPQFEQLLSEKLEILHQQLRQTTSPNVN